MSEHETAKAINDRAAEWVARIDRSDADLRTQAELDVWLAGDDRRRGAYFRAQAAWKMLDRASVLRGEERDRADVAARPMSRRRFVWGGGAIAASLALVATATGVWRSGAERIETATGEIRRVPLADGSFAAVNTRTRLVVDLNPEIRQIALEQGEAWFQVARDRRRPFVVEAGDVRVRAVGTAFSVRRLDGGANVQVTEGVVEVWSIGDEGNIRRITAGSRAYVRNDTGPQQVAEASMDIDRSLAWRTGQLIFDGDTLGQAAAEFNRYNRVQVTIADPILAQETLIGRFRTNEPDAFARAAAGMLGARVTLGNDEITLSRN